MRFARDVCLNFESALGRHWLETDGLGGFGASTLLLCPTSRYHGLLVVPSREQPERHVFLARCEEMLHADGREFPISDARYPGSFSPGGHRFVDHCEFLPRPVFTYRIGHVRVTREVQMVRGRPVVLLKYRATGQRKPVELRLRPFLPCRRADSLSWMNDSLDEEIREVPRGIAVRPYAALPQVVLKASREMAFDRDPRWFRGLEYGDDVYRGYDGHEDQWTPGVLRCELDSGDELVLAASIGQAVDDPVALWERESARRETAAAERSPGLRGTLERAADHFLYRTPEGRPGVIAGFPWFGEWGRDTLIALPGLTLSRGLVEQCGEVLSGLLPYLHHGRLPNVFGPRPAESDYKAIDSAMWFGRAVQLYANAGGSRERIRDELFPALVEIAEAHRGANEVGRVCDADGLLHAGTPDVATTWMDAVIDGRPVTARDGAQVEVNALWYVLVDLVAKLFGENGESVRRRDWEEFRNRLGEAFVRRFWIASKDRLADRLIGDEVDDTVRPNMVIAAALDPSPLSREQRAAVVRLARSELLTPHGLRTLSPRYLRYRGRFEGDQRSRDDAYHQGAVWPWLLGFYVEAALRAEDAADVAGTAARLREILDGFERHLSEHGVGQISEIFDGDPPHRPGGCFAQAWSVAELLRGYSLLDAGES